MRILYLDLDTTRPDHFGCYGYHRNTSPTIDWIASQGVRFENCYVSDAPCLPSRAALAMGRFGIHTGVVGHGGTAADPYPVGPERPFAAAPDRLHWFHCLQRAGFRPVSISPFPQRHAAWWFCGGLKEWYNFGKNGNERADEVNSLALPWLEQNAEKDNWFLHVNYWDPHTPYRTPEEYGNPFADDPPPSWLTAEILQAHYRSYGPRSAQDAMGFGEGSKWPRMPDKIASLEDFRRWIDGYDVGIRYADEHIAQLLDILDQKGVLDETAIIISSDHGENQGELNIYGDHHTADHITCRVPLIIRWPGVTTTPRVDRALHYQFDMAATVLELVGARIPPRWEGRSFATALREGREEGRDYLVISQMAWSCQRGVRFDRWLLMRTYHDGFKDFPPVMLFDLENDPHELHNLAVEQPEVVNRGLALLEQWQAEMMATSTAPQPIDPMQTVLREGGPYHVRGRLEMYCERLRATGRAHHAEALEARFGTRRGEQLSRQC
ncbi:MAG TPA: sulfatase [Armatimonadetes bacterium]|nr:sulfatase [Armatimonadota bacterium]